MGALGLDKLVNTRQYVGPAQPVDQDPDDVGTVTSGSRRGKQVKGTVTSTCRFDLADEHEKSLRYNYEMDTRM
jgi:hypothetical protein